MRIIAVFACLMIATAASAVAWTREVLVLSSAPVSIVIAQPGQSGGIVQNRGPNSIFCATAGETPVLNKSLEIKSGGSLSLVGSSIVLKCLAATADQVTGAATIVVGVP